MTRVVTKVRIAVLFIVAIVVIPLVARTILVIVDTNSECSGNMNSTEYTQTQIENQNHA